MGHRTNKEKRIKSLNQLADEINILIEAFKIKDFIEEFRVACEQKDLSFWEDLSSEFADVSPMEVLFKFSEAMTDEEIGVIADITSKLQNKYNYEDFLSECEEIREKFLNDRSSYFSSRICKPMSSSSNENQNFIIEMTGMGDVFFARWLDRVLERIYPKHLLMSYEDISGDIKKIKVRYNSVNVTKDFIEGPLIDRYSGTNSYDSFLLHSFYDIKKKEWVYVPIRLIVSIDSADNFEMDIDT